MICDSLEQLLLRALHSWPKAMSTQLTLWFNLHTYLLVLAQVHVLDLSRKQFHRADFVSPKQCLHKVKVSSAPHPIPPVRRLWVHKEVGGDTQDKWPNWPKDIPQHRASFSACKVEGKEARGMMFGVLTSAFPSHHCTSWSPAFL